MKTEGVIAILTDFGAVDSYVAVMKAVMLSINPSARFIDISHEIEPGNIKSAAYVLFTAWHWFPDGTTFLSVIDPGVGSSRGILLASYKNKTLVSPDNGTAALLFRMQPEIVARKPQLSLLDKATSQRTEISSTFHGRDVFAPITALLSESPHYKAESDRCTPVTLDDVYPRIDRQKQQIVGKIIHIDHFGNCICTIHTKDLQEVFATNSIQIQHHKFTLGELKSYYAQVTTGSLLAYIGSSGFLEIGVRDGNAASIHGIDYGDEVTVTV